jgi:hypothetical protein
MPVLLAALAALLLATPAAAQGPKTPFEASDGADWTTHEQELAFLAQVAAGSRRVDLKEIGRTKQGRPLHRVEIGSPRPVGAKAARKRPTALVVCSQHGNEPSGREACLKQLRDLAFSTDPTVVDLLERTTWVFIPSANPDGRAANTRENADALDVNRDHLGLTSNEAKAMAKVVLDYQPEVAMDLHEYGPSQPVLYDDPVLWLWPRNLNTDQAVHDLAIEFGRQYLVPSIEEAGYTADEYGQSEVLDNDVAQTAGDADPGIMRNTMGLRHVLGILEETRVDADVRRSPTEAADNAEVQRRRVDSHMAGLRGLIRFMDARGAEAAKVTAAARKRKTVEGSEQSAPLYFDGADNQAPTAAGTVDPPPCGYQLTDGDLAKLGPVLGLHGIRVLRLDAGPFVPAGQAAEPLIPLLLDARGSRHQAEGKAQLADCPGLPVRPCTLTVKLPRVRGKRISVRVRAGGRRVKVRRGVARVTLRGAKVRVVIVQRARFKGKLRTKRTVRVYRVCDRSS